MPPDSLGKFHEFVLQGPRQRSRAREGLGFPKLAARLEVSFICRERARENPFLTVRTEASVERPDASFRGRLRHRHHQMLCGPHIFTDKYDIEVGAVSNLASAKFAHRDDGEIALASPQPVHKYEAGFGQRGEFGEERGKA